MGPRVLEADGRDANMEDVGRPSGITTGRPVAWAEKVQNSNGGGSRIPESVIEDEFVT